MSLTSWGKRSIGLQLFMDPHAPSSERSTMAIRYRFSLIGNSGQELKAGTTHKDFSKSKLSLPWSFIFD